MIPVSDLHTIYVEESGIRTHIQSLSYTVDRRASSLQIVQFLIQSFYRIINSTNVDAERVRHLRH